MQQNCSNLEISKRQLRKKERASKRDKYGYSMTLSRRQRRALRRTSMYNNFKSQTGTVTINHNGTFTAPSGHRHHYAGTQQCH